MTRPFEMGYPVYDTKYDDSSTAGMEYVEVAGLPGVYLAGRGRSNSDEEAGMTAEWLSGLPPVGCRALWAA